MREVLEELPDVVRRYFELDPRDVESFVALFSDEATVVDEGETRSGVDEIRAWRAGPAVKYTYSTEILGIELTGSDRCLVTGRLSGDFPGGTADLRWDFTLTGGQVVRLVIAP